MNEIYLSDWLPSDFLIFSSRCNYLYLGVFDSFNREEQCFQLLGTQEEHSNCNKRIDVLSISVNMSICYHENWLLIQFMLLHHPLIVVLSEALAHM